MLEVAVFACSSPASVRLECAGSSVACTRRRRGFVFVPVDETTRGYYLAWLAYELCHTIGETDKYRGDLSVFPQGYAPLSDCLYFRRRTLRSTPQVPSREACISSLSGCAIGAPPLRRKSAGSSFRGCVDTRSCEPIISSFRPKDSSACPPDLRERKSIRSM